jgi:hypothetical protein
MLLEGFKEITKAEWKHRYTDGKGIREIEAPKRPRVIVKFT